MAKKKKRKQSKSGDGKLLESMLPMALEPLGFTILRNAKERRAYDKQSLLRPSRVAKKQNPYTTIFGTPGKREWFITDEHRSYTVECKSQNGSGTVDEKMVLIARTFEEVQIEDIFILVYHGDWWTCSSRGRAIIEWIRTEAVRLNKIHAPRQLLIFNIDELQQFIVKTWGTKK